MKNWQKAIISILICLFIGLLGELVLFNPLSVSKVDAGCAPDCVERTVTRHQDWVVYGNWTCPSGWTLYWSNQSDKWRCKKNDDRQDATWVDASYWGSWSNWSTNSCTPSATKHCESKVQYKIGGGSWVDGNCPSPTPTPTPTPSPTICPTESPSPSPSTEPKCKTQNAECKINESDKLCCEGLTCVDEAGSPAEIGKCQPNGSPTASPSSEPVCEKESWTCEECHQTPTRDVCYSTFLDYCGGNYNCHWVTEGQWACDNECPTSEPSPSPTSTPQASTSTDSGAGGTSTTTTTTTTTTQTTTQETQGQVLGASTLPATGSFPENIMAVIQLLGFTLTGAGISAHAKGKKN